MIEMRQVEATKMPKMWFVLLIAQASTVFGVPTRTEGNAPLTPPFWGVRYAVTGVLRLPYAQIEEPFAAWFDGVKNRSRIDFYGGINLNS